MTNYLLLLLQLELTVIVLTSIVILLSRLGGYNNYESFLEELISCWPYPLIVFILVSLGYIVNYLNQFYDKL